MNRKQRKEKQKIIAKKAAEEKKASKSQKNHVRMSEAGDKKHPRERAGERSASLSFGLLEKFVPLFLHASHMPSGFTHA